MTRERLEGMRDRIIPWITHKVKGISLPNYSELDREKAREELEELFDLAIKALEQEPVLDKIYADIQRLRGCSCSCSDGIIDDVEDILDKYKAETEDK